MIGGQLSNFDLKRADCFTAAKRLARGLFVGTWLVALLYRDWPAAVGLLHQVTPTHVWILLATTCCWFAPPSSVTFIRNSRKQASNMLLLEAHRKCHHFTTWEAKIKNILATTFLPAPCLDISQTKNTRCLVQQKRISIVCTIQNQQWVA